MSEMFTARWLDCDGQEWIQTERGWHVANQTVKMLWDRDEVESNFGPLTPMVPDRLPIAEHDSFLLPDVAELVKSLEAPVFNYRMARGQLARTGYPKRLRKHEAEIREVVTKWLEKNK